jgi:hypothetical protein
MKRLLAHLTLLAISLLLSACLEMTSVITVNKNGSATIEETVLMSAQLKAMMAQGGGGQGGPDMKDIVPSKEKADERAKKLGEGVTVKSYETVKAPDGREGVKVTYAVKDIKELEYEPFNSEKKEGSKPMTFEVDDGELTVELPPDDKKKGEPPAERPKLPKEQMEQQLAMMKPMFAGMRIAMQIKGANGIGDTDATNVSDGTVTIMDIQFDKLMANSEAFSKFMETADDKDMTPAKAAEKFKGVDGIKIEGKEKIAIKLK